MVVGGGEKENEGLQKKKINEVKRGLEAQEEGREDKVLRGRGMEIVNPFLRDLFPM